MKKKKEIVARTAIVMISDGCKDDILAREWIKLESRRFTRKLTTIKIEGRVVDTRFKRGSIQDKRRPECIRTIDFYCIKSSELSKFPSAFFHGYADIGEKPPSVFLVAARLFTADKLFKHNWTGIDQKDAVPRKFIRLGAERPANQLFFFEKDNSYLESDILKILRAMENYIA